MLKLLLVDDEPLELKALRDHVDWEGMGISSVQTAGNGRIAYEMILEFAPDIVITDVHMPGVNGIELAKKIYELNRRIKVIFLSGYDEFSYVKSAMKMGAMDYLLKPFTEKEIQQVILKAKEEIGRDQLFSRSLDVLEQQLLKKICEEGEGAGMLKELSDIRDASWGKERFCMLMFWGITTQVLADYLTKNMSGIQAVWLDRGCMTVIFQGYVDPRERGCKIQQLLEKISGVRYSGVYFDQRYIKESELHLYFEVMKTWETYVYYQKEGFLCGVKKALQWEDQPQKNRTEWVEDEIDRLQKMFPYEVQENVEKEIDMLFDELMKMHLPRMEMEGVVSKICILLEHRLNPVYHGIQKQIFAKCKTESCKCMKDLKELAMEFFYQVYMQNRGGVEKDKTSYVVKKVQEYVQRHYGEAMTMEDMAEEIHLSVNYVRSIFKEGTGQTILEYITDYRFAKACELLQDPSLKVREIGSRVGYENSSYFGAVFTKRYGMTPNEYRKKNV